MTIENYNRVLVYTEYFNSAKPKYYIEKPGSVDPYIYSEEVNSFIELLYSEDFIMSGFDWPVWQTEGEKYIIDPHLITKASIDEIRKL